MDTDSAIALLNRVTYRNWSFTYHDEGGRVEGGRVIGVELEFDIENSSPPESRAGLHPGRQGDVFRQSLHAHLRVAPDDDETVILRKLERVIAAMEDHERREFLRVDGHAPFHGHRVDGEKAWADTSHVPEYVL